MTFSDIALQVKYPERKVAVLNRQLKWFAYCCVTAADFSGTVLYRLLCHVVQDSSV